MEKIIFAAFVSFISLSASLTARDWNPTPIREERDGILLEAKFVCFYPTSHVLHEIFPGVMPGFSVEASGPIWKNFHLWGDVGYITKHGHSLGGHQKTSIHIVPITLGVEYVYRVNDSFKVYAGLGPRYFFVNVINHSDFVHRHDTGNGLGGVFRGGALIYLKEYLALDLFVDYSLKTMEFSGSSKTIERHDLNLSGINFGIGLGYQF
jgi:outer membrane protein